MKVQVLAGVLFAGAMSLSAPAMAQASAQATATGSTTIIRPVTIANTAGLAFGRIVKPTSGTGTVSISNSADTVTVGNNAVALAGVATSRAKFTIDGESGQAITVIVPATFDLTSTINSANTIAVTLDPDNAGTQTLSNGPNPGSAGSLALNVGGSFSVPSNLATGNYTGSFNVTVQYN